MKRWIFLGFFFCSGCGIFVTKENVKYASTGNLCQWAFSGLSSKETANIALSELESRNETCSGQLSSSSSGLTYKPTPASTEMMRIGSQLMIQGAPKPLYVPPPPPAPIRCQTFYMGNYAQTKCQ